jgi:Ras-related protein Rab-6A
MSWIQTPYIDSIKIKLVMLGDQDVGKTSIIQKYMSDTYQSSGSNPTIGIDFQTKKFYMESKLIKLVVWDTAGQERFRSLTPHYIKNADAVVIAYDITSRETFNSISDWIEKLRDYSQWGSFVPIIIGNKNDLAQKRQVSFQEGQDKASSLDCSFFEASAKSGEAINDIFELATQKILDGTSGAISYGKFVESRNWANKSNPTSGDIGQEADFQDKSLTVKGLEENKNFFSVDRNFFCCN